MTDEEHIEEHTETLHERMARVERELAETRAQVRQPPAMTPGRAAAEARALMTRGYELEAKERAARKAGEAA